MKNTLSLIGAAVVAFAGLGWYLGWYQIKNAAAGSDGHRTVTIDFNAKKIEEDIGKGKEKLQSTLDKVAKEDNGKDKLVRDLIEATQDKKR